MSQSTLLYYSSLSYCDDVNRHSAYVMRQKAVNLIVIVT